MLLSRIAKLKKSWILWTLVALLAVIALLIAYIYVPRDLEWLREGNGALAETYSATLRNIGLLIAGIIALPLALWRSIVAHSQAKSAQGQLATTQQSLRQERYQRGAEMLGNELLSTRLGGIYTLTRLAKDYPEEYHLQVMDLLCALVRNPYGVQQPIDQGIHGWEDVYLEQLSSSRNTPFKEDTRAIISFISQRGTVVRNLEKSQGFRPDLRLANFTRANLSQANLSDTDLTGSLFLDANCDYSNFSDSILINANFYLASCFEANMAMAKLHSASMDSSNVSRSDFTDAILQETTWRNADLSRAYFCDAEFIDAIIDEAKLDGTDLSGTRFSCFWNSHLTLTQAQLDKAVADPNNPPVLPLDAVDPHTGETLEWRGHPPPRRSGTPT